MSKFCLSTNTAKMFKQNRMMGNFAIIAFIKMGQCVK